MFKTIKLTLFVCIVLMANYALADTAVELEQAKAHIIDYITEGKETEAADAYQKLMTAFAGNPLISSAVYDIAETYRNSAKFEQSLQVYQDVVGNWPASSSAVWAQMGLAISSIAKEKYDTAADQKGIKRHKI